MHFLKISPLSAHICIAPHFGEDLLILRPNNQMFDSSTGLLNLKALGLVWLQLYILNCLNVMFKLFLNLIFNRTGATLNAGLGWLGAGTVSIILIIRKVHGGTVFIILIIRKVRGGTVFIILRKKHYKKGPIIEMVPQETL